MSQRPIAAPPRAGCSVRQHRCCLRHQCGRRTAPRAGPSAGPRRGGSAGRGEARGRARTRAVCRSRCPAWNQCRCSSLRGVSSRRLDPGEAPAAQDTRRGVRGGKVGRRNECERASAGNVAAHPRRIRLVTPDLSRVTDPAPRERIDRLAHRHGSGLGDSCRSSNWAKQPVDAIRSSARRGWRHRVARPPATTRDAAA